MYQLFAVSFLVIIVFSLHTGCEIPQATNQPPSLKSIADSVALQAALQPIQGSEFDLEETVIHIETSGSEPTNPLSMEPSISTAEPSPDNEDVETELKAIKESIERDHPDTTSTPTEIVRKYPNLIFPTGPLKKKSHAFIYTSLFKMRQRTPQYICAH